MYVGHVASVTCATLCRNTKRCITGSVDTTIRTWSVVNGENLQTLKGSQCALFDVLVFGCQANRYSSLFVGGFVILIQIVSSILPFTWNFLLLPLLRPHRPHPHCCTVHRRPHEDSDGRAAAPYGVVSALVFARPYHQDVGPQELLVHCHIGGAYRFFFRKM